MGVWLPAKAKPLQNHHIRSAVSSLQLPSTRKTLTDWSKSCKGKKDGWGLETIMDKERWRELGFFLRNPSESNTRRKTQASWWDLKQWIFFNIS